MSKITKIIISTIKRICFGHRATSESYIKKLKELGAAIGDDVIIFRPFNTNIDIQNPHLLSIGDHVMITGPATILTHDYSWSVIKRKYGYIAGKQVATHIGNNVFIGWGATILPGTTIGDNVIIGANSVVGGSIKGDSVYAGNPAKCLMSLDDFYKKRRDAQLNEALNYVLCYERQFGNMPKAEELDEYFFLFTSSINEEVLRKYKSKLELMGNYEITLDTMKEHIPSFDSYEMFIDYCIKHK